ncbi:hypothetical protein [Variovorax sp.]|uniref:hypothetical protein n=1 Tax=Variovorax sp. TaxID=1871043 RepID=UPI0025E1C9FB|nr:hypothetical protein [Variovorax sp.]
MEDSISAWEAALLLYQTSKQPMPAVPRAVARRWQFIACNECILELYHLRARLEKVHTVLLAGCPSIRPLIDTSKLKAARKRLNEDFPHIEALRHATAHKGEIEAFPEQHAADGNFALSGFREADRYSLNYKGQIRFLDITPQSLHNIAEAVQAFFDGFAPAAAKLKNEGHLD